MRITIRNFLLLSAFSACISLYGVNSVYGGGYGESTYYSESPYYSQTSYTYSAEFTQDVITSSNVSITGDVNKGSGTFVIDHPLDPENKLLYHSFVESPDAKNLYDGIAELDEYGEVTVMLPHYFEALNGDYRYALSPLGMAMPNLFIKTKIRDNRFTIAGGVPHGRVSWQVSGIRHDPYILANPIVPEVEKGEGQLVSKGEYVHPGVYSLEDPQNIYQIIWGWLRELFSRI